MASLTDNSYLLTDNQGTIKVNHNWLPFVQNWQLKE